ncbi:hypothetical protein WIS52_16570 [Pseudonocardia nematodicida]|uniref:DUF998 domain-containing protein n=1 Tax=Pseudonocardia nematodicida TaxID=1206997 RepID=A0ABV1KC88_9PSEU
MTVSHQARNADEDPVTAVIPRVPDATPPTPGAGTPAPVEPSPEPAAPAAAPHLALLRPSGIVTTAAAVVTVLAVAHFAAAVYGIGRPGFQIPEAIRLGAELNVSTWFSSALHLVNAGLLALIAANSVRRERWRWILLSICCAVVAMDETAANHEQVGWIIHTTFGTSGLLTYAWIIPAVFLVAVVALLCAPMLLRRPGGLIVAAGATLFVFGAVGLEAVGGAMFDASGGDGTAFDYVLVSGAEETLEMVGLVVAMAGLLRMAGGAGLRIAGTFTSASRP